MSEQTYDVIVIGAGENGLVLGNYLGLAGLKVLVCERRLESGGGLSTEESTVLGCWHNTGSYYHDTVDLTPIYRDLNLEDYNTLYVHPPVQSSVVRRDGESLTVFADVEKTAADISRWSKKDAETWRRHCQSYDSALDRSYRPYFLKPAHNGMGLEDFDGRAGMTPLQAVRKEFEHPLTQTLLLSHFLIPRGMACDDEGAGRFLQMVVAGCGRTRIVEGGTHELAQSLWTAQLRNNGWVWDSTPVKRILIENGQAVGVETVTGRILRSRVVASTVDLHKTFFTLVGREHLPAQFAAGLEGYQMEDFSLLVIHAALNEPPRLNAKSPDAGSALRWTLGFETPDDIVQHLGDVRAGRLPDRLGAFVSCPSQHDPSQALPGKQTLLVWQIVPAKLKSGSWGGVAESYTKKVLGWLEHYMPNVSGKNLLLPNTMTPDDFVVKWNLPHPGVFCGRSAGSQLGATRPLPGVTDFRTPIKNLYLGGAYMHPGAGILGAPGYIAAGVIASDLGIKLGANAASKRN